MTLSHWDISIPMGYLYPNGTRTSLNIGLRLDGLTKAVDENKEEFNNIMKELLIKYNIFSPGPETRFILLVAKTVYITHHMNMAIEKKKEIINNTDPSVIENLKTKFNKI